MGYVGKVNMQIHEHIINIIKFVEDAAVYNFLNK